MVGAIVSVVCELTKWEVDRIEGVRIEDGEVEEEDGLAGVLIVVSTGVELEGIWVCGTLDELESMRVELDGFTGVLDEVDGTSVLGLTEDTAVLDTIGVTEVLDGIELLGGVSVALDPSEVSVPQTVSVTTMVRTSGWSE